MEIPKKFIPGMNAKKDDTPKCDYPSFFGSHISMIDEGLTNQMLVKVDDDGKELVVCRDQFGPYITQKWRTSDDVGTADPNRYNGVECRSMGIKKYLPEGVDLSEKKEE